MIESLLAEAAADGWYVAAISEDPYWRFLGRWLVRLRRDGEYGMYFAEARGETFSLALTEALANRTCEPWRPIRSEIVIQETCALETFRERMKQRIPTFDRRG